MANINLLNVLTKEDKEKINHYIELYGANRHFVGVDNWLQSWSKSNVKLYKLLGNQLTITIPYKQSYTETEIRNEIEYLFNSHMFSTYIKKLAHKKQYNEDLSLAEQYSQYDSLYRLFTGSYFLTNGEVLRETITLTVKSDKKPLKLPKGMKLIKAMQKIMQYFKEDLPDNIEKLFEDFRIKHSMIYNNKICGDLVLSIHPLDFMTLSDNNSNWTSCMNWMEGGCYRVGSIEMMNSNNVICCYLKRNTPFRFDEGYEWSNKKWRQLVYVHKDIIVSGKAYPYVNDDLSKFIIKKVRELAKRNLHWTYSFDIAPYKDMIHINGSYSMNRAYEFIKNNNTTKHNILFDTKGMYNDFLNDSTTTYWCVRNKVNRTKIISVSGKAPCLCCEKPIIYPNRYTDENGGTDSYNSRYDNVSATVCEDCQLKYFMCQLCRTTNTQANTEYYLTKTVQGSELNISNICSTCFDNQLRKCPCCGKLILIVDAACNTFFVKQGTKVDAFSHGEFIYNHMTEWSYTDLDEDFQKDSPIIPVRMCKECAKKIPFIEKKESKTHWYYTRTYKYKIYYATDKEMDTAFNKFIYPALETPEKDINKTYYIKGLYDNDNFSVQ